MAEEPEERALQALLDIVKLTLALATGALVFSVGLLQEDVLLSWWSSFLVKCSWVLLGLSILAGTVALHRLPVKISEGELSMDDRYLNLPGKVHHILFILGMAVLGAALFVMMSDKLDAQETQAPVEPRLETIPAFEQVGVVTGFETGDTLLPATALSGFLLQPWVQRLAADSSAALCLVVIGSADKRELKALKRQVYGSNESLAMARARVVRRIMCDHARQLGNDLSSRVITLSSGSSFVGIGLSENQLLSDRSVSVYAFTAITRPPNRKELIGH